MLDRAGNAVNPTDTTPFLRALAKRLADSYGAHAQPSAILLVGSAATGGADAYSDLDMLFYYARVPPDAKMAKAPREVGAERYQGTPWSDESGESDERGYSERYSVDDIECQIGHMSVGSFDREIRRVVVDLEVNEELLKIMSGLFEGLRASALREPADRAVAAGSRLHAGVTAGNHREALEILSLVVLRGETSGERRHCLALRGPRAVRVQHRRCFGGS